MNYEFLLLILLLLILTPLLGRYLANVFCGRFTVLQPLENLCYKIAKVNPQEEMSWGSYAKQLFLFHFIGFFFLFFILIFQHYLPLNPQGFHGVSWPLAGNIAASFIPNNQDNGKKHDCKKETVGRKGTD